MAKVKKSQKEVIEEIPEVQKTVFTVPPIVLPGGLRKQILDYVLRHENPVTMLEITQAIDDGEFGPMVSSKHIGPHLYAQAKGYGACKYQYPLLQVVLVEGDGTTRAYNGFTKLPHVTEEYMAACEKMTEDKKFETSVARVKQVRVLQPDGSLTMTARDGTEIVVGKRDKHGKTQSVTPMKCSYCNHIQPNMNDMQFILGIGWFCKDPCLDKWRKENGYDD